MILLTELMSGKSGNREGLIYPLQRDQSLPVIKGPLALIRAELNNNYWLTKCWMHVHRGSLDLRVPKEEVQLDLPLWLQCHECPQLCQEHGKPWWQPRTGSPWLPRGAFACQSVWPPCVEASQIVTPCASQLVCLEESASNGEWKKKCKKTKNWSLIKNLGAF